MNHYDNDGAMTIGSSVFRTRMGQGGELTRSEQETRRGSRIDWTLQCDVWRESTIGETIQRDDGKIGTNKEHELAFFVLNHDRRVTWNTPCQIGTNKAGKVLRVMDTEYRTLEGRLWSRVI